MSELVRKNNDCVNFRWKLMSGVSAMALACSVAIAQSAHADERPTVWIELGGQLEQLSDKQEVFDPLFVAKVLENPFKSPIALQSAPRFAMGEEMRISFQPEDSGWVFSVTLRYGRASRNVNSHEESVPVSAERIASIPANNVHVTQAIPPFAARFSTTVSQIHNSQTILDFEAGKDVGLGVFGAHGSSTISAGIRYAQFTSRTRVTLAADPDFAFSYKYLRDPFGYTGYIKGVNEAWDVYDAKMTVTRHFSGVGPSLKWDGNAVIAGTDQAAAITFDWGLNGALLFGRQKMRAHEQTTAHHGVPQSHPLTLTYQTSHDTVRSRAVVIPNVGGFAGLSLRFPNARVSLGYRADAFFGAMDGGIETRKTYDRDFYGPFATVSIGLGG